MADLRTLPLHGFGSATGEVELLPLHGYSPGVYVPPPPIVSATWHNACIVGPIVEGQAYASPSLAVTASASQAANLAGYKPTIT